jgi:hypothetical protein
MTPGLLHALPEPRRAGLAAAQGGAIRAQQTGPCLRAPTVHAHAPAGAIGVGLARAGCVPECQRWVGVQ